MTKEEFSELFFETLEELPIPTKNTIKDKWENREPMLLLSDEQIDQALEGGFKNQRTAFVFESGYYWFGFRSYIVAHAPLEVAKSIIRHELIHVFLGPKRKTPSLEERLLSQPTSNPIINAATIVREMRLSWQEEYFTSTINDSNGADEETV